MIVCYIEKLRPSYIIYGVPTFKRMIGIQYILYKCKTLILEFFFIFLIEFLF